ncbi:MAG: sensor histidine kinase [Ruminococcus sp.]|uniref:Sensor histidine kinase n=1 Tax=Schaedlerella arabinosiphila TaxID=2044587 RepID=A0A3R8JSS7_9FIRM|nr:sensor histidine kinase [Schaedlerella arabinosiphila]MCI8724386.1 sensor histidine kinase [Ruminococcus sp.]RRK35106.1 sensor histidine kinase [Schaedlerella arabinosiphila]
MRGGDLISVRKKLMLILAGIVIVLGLFIGYCSYEYALNMVTENKKSEMADTINRIDININFWGLEVTRLAQRIVDGNIAGEAFEEQEAGQISHLNEWVSDYAHIIEAVSDIIILDTERNIRYHYLEGLDMLQDGRRLQECFEAAQSGLRGERWLGRGNSLYQGGEAVTLVKAIPMKEKDRMRGIVVIEINPEIFRSLLLSNQSLPISQYTFIVDKKGQILCTNRTVQPKWLEKIETTFQNGERSFILEWDQETYDVFGQYNGLTGWKTYSVVAVQDIFPQAAQLRGTIAMIVMLAVFAGLVAVTVLSCSITAPIRELSNAMKQVEQENFDIEIQSRRKDEIGHLITSFHYMVGKIRQLICEVYQKKIEQKNAEIRALQAQINPHFLYNTLDSINWMLIERDEQDISDVVISLGEILRYAVGGQNHLVPLGSEARYIESYLFIQKNRLEDRLNYQWELAEDTLDVLVPRLIMQPIVENAVIHGIEPLKKGGVILMKAWIEKEMLLIRVTDNGRGMNQEELEALREKISGTDEIENIGMRNIQRRMELTYGQEQAMEIESVQGEGATITLRMKVCRAV